LKKARYNDFCEWWSNGKHILFGREEKSGFAFRLAAVLLLLLYVRLASIIYADIETIVSLALLADVAFV
jgi:hypothetical protein